MTAQGPEIVIQQDEEVLGSMNAWCIEHHGASGLTQRCRESSTSMQEAEEQVGIKLSQLARIRSSLQALCWTMPAWQLSTRTMNYVSYTLAWGLRISG